MPQKTEANILIVLLGGSGQRFQSGIPKQFLKLPGEENPLFLQTLLAFTAQINFQRVILVINTDYSDKPEFLEPLTRFEILRPELTVDIVAGGKDRHHSFINGAELALKLHESGLVAVHDANRPFISASFAREIHHKMLNLSRESPCFIPVVPSADSLCQSENAKITAYLPRDQIMAIQTPQLIYLPSLREALKRKALLPSRSGYTDEGSFMHAMGFPVYVFPGDPSNKKITYAEDAR